MVVKNNNMKYIFLVTLSVFVLNGSSQVIVNTTLNDFNLKGNIKIITNKNDSIFGDIFFLDDFTALENTEYKFYSNGKLLYEKSYNSDYNLIKKKEYKYDTLGRLNYIIQGIYKKTFHYDSLSRLKIITNRFTDDTDSFFYNNSGDILKVVYPNMTDEYTYDKKTQSYQITTNQQGGNEVPIFYTTVDSLGNETEYTMKMKWIDDYDCHVKYEYNFKNDIVSCSVKTLYNEYIKWHFVYVYDPQENWIERIDFKDGIKIRTYTRLITYY